MGHHASPSKEGKPSNEEGEINTKTWGTKENQRFPSYERAIENATAKADPPFSKCSNRRGTTP